MGNRRWDIPEPRELLETVLPRDQAFAGYAVTIADSTGGRQALRLNARRLPAEEGAKPLILLAMDAAGS